ncbi:ubiquitin carboxyl-terminal hydrolase 31 [Asbolus verrucosus]|uniref:ubiquitinyl hydrolase 1 n=1 Tax=Asbolus verrucosus TaxID=1661398 RepID=A0A482VR84_ASBVE|nr:ubiquitin carboxyl-terminal hydrolase 31 [Asbolus verrucosus]
MESIGSPYTMQVSRETSYEDLQKLILKEMAPILHDDILTSSQPRGVFKIRISDPACNDNEPPCYLEPELEHPLFMEAVDQALALCSEEGGPPHVKLVMEFASSAKSAIIADDGDLIEEHSSVKQLKAQALHGGAPLTLEECLRDYTEAETLTDAWRCPHCQQYQPVVKTLDMWSLPDILVVHFKRFRQQTLRGCSSAKLTTMVDFPVYNLDMTPHLANKGGTNLNHDDGQVIMTNGWSPFKRARKQSNANDNMYDLYGICYHHGSDIETGHYTAACKNPYDNQWYLYDDAKVTNLSKQTDDISSLLVNNSAYILFYQRRNGLYVGSSSNTSSAASTSSVGSSTDHWVSRMPKFMPPKNLKATEKKQASNERLHEDNRENKEETLKASEEVALRNSQNALHSSGTNVRKSLENKSTNTVALEKNEPEAEPEVNKKPLYTTSIYINSCGDVDILTKTTKGVSHDDVNVSLTEPEVRKVYTTTAAVHRYSDNDNVSRTRLNWVIEVKTIK